MAFLEDLGRSNALSSVNNLMGKAIEMRQGEDKSAERAYTMGLQTEELGIHKAAAEREATKFQWQAEEQAKKQKFNKSVVPLDTILQNVRPGTRDALLKLGKDNGWIKDVGGNLVISNEDLANAKTYLSSNLDITSQLALTDVADINKEMVPLKDQLAELKATKPDDKNIPVLQQRIAELDKQKISHLNNAMELDKAFQEKKALEDTRQGALKNSKVASDPNSATGFSYFSADGSVLLRGAPKPASAVSENKLTETERHNRAMETIRKATGGGAKPTALMQNTEFLSHLGWSKEEAAKLLSGSKPMSRESYIGKVTSKIMSDEMISPDEKANRVTEAISVYDTVIAKPGSPSPTTGKVLDKTTAEAILKETGGDKNKAREIARKRGYKF